VNHLTLPRRGATMVAVVILLPVLFILGAMAINLSHIQVVKTKVQIVTDASVRAAGRTYAETGDEAAALLAAQQMATANPIQGAVLPIAASDLDFGLSERSGTNQKYIFTAGTNGNAVRLTTNSFAGGAGTALQPYFAVGGSNFDIRPVCSATSSQTTLDVCLVVDRSGSMAFAANEPTGGTPAAAPPGWSFGDAVPPNSRWLDLVASVNGFCAELTLTSKVEKVALVSYASSVKVEEELTNDYSKINSKNQLISADFYGGATNIGGGIDSAISAVKNKGRPWANRVIVLMSDGIHNTGTNPITAAQNAVAAEIPIYTVSFSNEADIAVMQQIADMTGGDHYHAVNAQQLNDAFRNIARRLPSLLTE
jgi:Ca-activated chloride channel homolog